MYFSQVWILCIQHTFDSPEKYEPVNTRSWLSDCHLCLFDDDDEWWWPFGRRSSVSRCVACWWRQGMGEGQWKLEFWREKKKCFQASPEGLHWGWAGFQCWWQTVSTLAFLFLSQPRCLQSCVSMHKECLAADELCSSVCLRRRVLLLRAVWCHGTKLSSQCSFVCAFWIRLLSEEVGRKLPFELQTGIPVITHFLHSGNPFLLGSMVTNYCLHGVDKLFMLRWFCVTCLKRWYNWQWWETVCFCSNISMVCQLVGRLKVKKNQRALWLLHTM